MAEVDRDELIAELERLPQTVDQLTRTLGAEADDVRAALRSLDEDQDVIYSLPDPEKNAHPRSMSLHTGAMIGLIEAGVLQHAVTKKVGEGDLANWIVVFSTVEINPETALAEAGTAVYCDTGKPWADKTANERLDELMADKEHLERLSPEDRARFETAAHGLRADMEKEQS